MTGFKIAVVSSLALAAVQMGACTSDRTLPLAVDGSPRANLETPIPFVTVEPSEALYSDRVEVTLRFATLASPVAAVYIDTVAASQVSQVDATTISAVFEGGSPARVGTHAVAVNFASGTSATLAKGFSWRHDQDPVVFVHGCPLPKQSIAPLGAVTNDPSVPFGSITNYATSQFWHKLYAALKARGYPGPSWDTEKEFMTEPFDHAATKPSDRNFLNVFVLSEDRRNPAHTEDAAPKGLGAGHCGSGLLMAQALNAYVNEVLEKTRAFKVDLVVNSGGALAARWFLHPSGYGGASKVRDIVFLAAMNHGTEVAIVPTVHDMTATWWSPNYEMAREGFPSYACENEGRGGRETNNTQVGNWEGRDLQFLVNGCLHDPARESGVELPDDHRLTRSGSGGVAYLNIYNAVADELIEPTTAACLNQKFKNDCSDTDVNVPVHAVDLEKPRDTPHGAIRGDPEVVALTACYLTRRSHRQKAPRDNCEPERTAARLPGM